MAKVLTGKEDPETEQKIKLELEKKEIERKRKVLERKKAKGIPILPERII